jgi:acetyltransferase-like isoleucine patch superfamily enzyme
MKLGEIFKLIYGKLVKYGSADKKIHYLRKLGVKIGENCIVNSLDFSTEPFLIEIGNLVSIASDVKFITHDGSVRCFKSEVDGGIFGKIIIGNNVFIGTNSIIMLNTTIGNNCIVGAGSVVRGQFPDNSVIVGNPAKVILSMNIQRMLFRHSPGFVKTNNIAKDDAQKLVKKHFGLE